MSDVPVRFEMYLRTRVRISLSISLGWSPTGIYVQTGSPSCQFTKQTNLRKETYIGKSRKIDQGEVERCRAVYPQVDRQRHALVLARDTERLLFNPAPDLGEVDKLFFEVEELAPLVATRGVDQLKGKQDARTIPPGHAGGSHARRC